MTNEMRKELATRIETNPLGWLPVVGDVINITFTPEEAALLTTALRAQSDVRAPAPQGEPLPARAHARGCSIYNPGQPCDCEGPEHDQCASLRAQLAGCGGDVKACTSDVPCALGALAQIEHLRAQLEGCKEMFAHTAERANEYVKAFQQQE